MYKDTDITFLATLQEALRKNPDASQRDIAQKQEISLGMTNAVLARLAKKGWIMMQRLDGRKIRYVLTPVGLSKLAERSNAYMRRTFADMRLYGTAIARRIQGAKSQGLSRVVLYGRSDLDFLIEYSCRMFGMDWSVADVSELSHGVPAGTYGIVGELSGEAAEEFISSGDGGGLAAGGADGSGGMEELSAGSVPGGRLVTAYELAS